MKVKKRYVFKCPECKYNVLELIHTGATVNSKIIAIDQNGDIEYAYPEIDDELKTETYQCDNCGYVIANNHDELLLKIEQEYFAIKPSFVTELIDHVEKSLFIELDNKDDFKISIIQYLKEKGIEVEE